MAVPFCNACGATVAEGTRFCVKCGQPIGQAAPPVPAPSAEFPTVQMPLGPPPGVPPPPPVSGGQIWTPPPPPPPPPGPVVQPVKEGSGAGVWIGIFAILLLLGGAGLWFYMARSHGGSTGQVAAVPSDSTPVPQSTPLSTPTPTPGGSTFVPAPTPNPSEPEAIPANPDQQQKNEPPAPTPPPIQAQPKATQTRPAQNKTPVPVADPGPARPAATARQTSGVLHAAVQVAQNGEVVFENLPAARLRFTFDHSAWQPTISRQANGTQTLVMRSLKPGIQTTCDVRWEIVE